MNDLSSQAQYLEARKAVLALEDRDCASKETTEAYERFKSAALRVLESYDTDQLVERFIERQPSNSLAPDKVDQAQKEIAAYREKLRTKLNDPDNREIIILDFLPSIWENLLKEILKR